MKVTLHDFIEGQLKRTCMVSLPNGKGYTNKTYIFDPHTEYTAKDPVLQRYFRGEIGDVEESKVKTPDIIEKLKYYGVEYRVSKCSSCPSAQPHVHFNPFKIVED